MLLKTFLKELLRIATEYAECISADLPVDSYVNTVNQLIDKCSLLNVSIDPSASTSRRVVFSDNEGTVYSFDLSTGRFAAYWQAGYTPYPIEKLVGYASSLE